ncbi:hypothetical protein NQ176_g2556 [Zarea fungicola]|uniref:Uncharacterized protein n=1 Tax=Zarea fungicola TaxID=93591 RepID=A0ACC1NNR5_9HYPO|nr:hypothetical protein NQ176_g2556 [Lecanicillium fungicola]
MAALLTFALFSLAAAAPAAESKYPEVIPGPGLPSLESLGLTSEQLYTMPIPKEFAAFKTSLNIDGTCGPEDSRYTDVNGIIACFHYLQNLGTTPCVAGENTRMCEAGDAVVIGSSIGGGSSSYCSDVALGALWVIDHCTRPDQSCAGYQAANGNGNLIVVTGSKHYFG